MVVLLLYVYKDKKYQVNEVQEKDTHEMAKRIHCTVVSPLPQTVEWVAAAQALALVLARVLMLLRFTIGWIHANKTSWLFLVDVCRDHCCAFLMAWASRIHDMLGFFRANLNYKRITYYNELILVMLYQLKQYTCGYFVLLKLLLSKNSCLCRWIKKTSSFLTAMSLKINYKKFYENLSIMSFYLIPMSIFPDIN